MAERANAQGGTVPTAPTTLDNPAPTAPAGSTQEKKPKIPTASDFHMTPNQPYVAATDSGYKVYPNAQFHAPGSGSMSGHLTTGVKLEGPDGKTLGFMHKGGAGWTNPQGTGQATGLDGLKSDPAWFDSPPKSNAT